MKRISLAVAAVLMASTATAALAASQPQIDAAKISEHVKVLSSDEFEGRGPATPGEEKAIAYIAKQFEAAGLQPGGPNGSWFQDVTLLRTQKTGPVTASVKAGAWSHDYVYGKEIVVGTQQPVDHITLKDAPLVFVGYGVHAPERGWDDYAGLDMHGKVAVVLVNDPDFEADLGGLFGGKAMTYYGRWTYKFEEAARQGAAGVIIVHETKPASYGWATVEGSWSAPQFDIVRADPMKERAPVQGWVQRDQAVELFKQAGLDFEALRTAAHTKGFKAVPMNASFSTDFAVQADKTVTHNVIARLVGKKRPGETIIYGAHWDHLGRGVADANGDDIYNGALDNASGTAGLLELGRVFAAGPRPDRSIVFIAYTAEEKGLLGSEFYAANPVYPLETTVAGFNMDGLPTNGPTKDVEVVGFGQSDLQDDLQRVAAKQHRVIVAESSPEAGHYYRSDHFPFAKRGVPMLYAGAGEDLVNGGKEAGKKASEEYNTKRYHQPDDEFNPNWDWSGAVQDLDMLRQIGMGLANTDRWSQWKAGSEFKPVRDKSEAARKK
ncbi:M28 family metallopeptidase [Caulobacter sp. 17J80-11]|uniref:M28 family metallopeptidase n=1 Tax=Caulobacter sp. 17J80-11 TaxID=2763502 RepID=UPI001653EE28|nr:M28 family metallopeptidase [Caulobacter sp. 17J80-11]MBC6982246.1 M28 family peptidase [Caulobacter sp. 17J80-11]